jgi:hypothetical protein
MAPLAPEMRWPLKPTSGITWAEDQALLGAETEALAPWKQALALARKAGRPGRAAAAQAKPLAPERAPNNARLRPAHTGRPSGTALVAPAEADVA